MSLKLEGEEGSLILSQKCLSVVLFTALFSDFCSLLDRLCFFLKRQDVCLWRSSPFIKTLRLESMHRTFAKCLLFYFWFIYVVDNVYCCKQLLNIISGSLTKKMPFSHYLILTLQFLCVQISEENVHSGSFVLYNVNKILFKCHCNIACNTLCNLVLF